MSVLLSNVGYTYAGTDARVLSGVTGDFAPGGVHAVTGRMGSGCSTLLMVMAGLAPRVIGGTRQGEVRVLGHDPSSRVGASELRGRVGLLLPSPWTQLSGMTYTVRDEVAFGPANLQWPATRIAQRVDAALSDLGITHLADRDPVTLSGGELLLTVLAGIMAMAPDVLLLDEPVQELSPAKARDVLALVGGKPDLTTIVATADADLAAAHADTVLVLDEGAVAAAGAPEEAYRVSQVRAADATTTIGSIFTGVADERCPITPAEGEEVLRA